MQVVEAGADRGVTAALFAQARFDRFAFGFGFGVAQLLQQAFDRGVRVGQFFGRADGRRGDVVGRVVALAALRRSEEKVASVSSSLRLGISSSKLAPVAPALPLWTEEWRTTPLAAWTAS